MQKRYFLTILLMIAVLALVPAVSAANYAYWNSHYYDVQYGIINSPNPNGIFDVYSDTTYTDPIDCAQYCMSIGGVLTSNSVPMAFRRTDTGGDAGIVNLLKRYQNQSYGTKLIIVNGQLKYNDVNEYISLPDGSGLRRSTHCTRGTVAQYTFGPTYVYHASNSPIDYNYPNLTITAISLSSGLTIPRVDIDVQVTPDQILSGKTDLNGEIFFGMVGSTSENSNKTITASKVGYNTTVTSVNLTENTEISVYLADTPWDTSGTKAVVYLDIIDEDTSAAISGATIGIKNTTNEINPWHYNTYEDSTIAFSTDGTNDLSVGQTIEFAGYKSGFYSAGHTDPISILAPVSHASLALSKSDVIDPLDIVNGSYYWYPVTVVDSVTGNAISGSDLNYQVTDDLYFINKTSATGKFNMTGKGPMGVIPFENGDTIMIEGYADGYIRGGYALGVDSDNSGVTQFVSLVPSSYQAVSGEWTAVLLAYDDDSTAALSGVSIQLKNATSRWSKSTTSSGSATFTNLISGESYTLTASKSGYTTMTKTITGWSAGIVSIDVPLSKTSVNPSITTTITPLPGETSAPASDDNISGWMRTRAIDLMDWFYFFIILGSLGILLKMFNLI